MHIHLSRDSLPLLLLAASTVLASPLDLRTDESLDGTMYCGTVATGSKTTVRGLLTDLDAGANGKISGKTFTIAAGACQRVHCWDTTGIYVCNVRLSSSPPPFLPFHLPTYVTLGYIPCRPT